MPQTSALAAFFLLGGLQIAPALAQNSTSSQVAANTSAALPATPAVDQGFACAKCVSRRVRVLYLHDADGTECLDCPRRGAECSDASTAVAACFRWRSWRGGWVGSTLHRVLTELAPPEIVAMTPANFSAASRTVYRGGSTYTRCVHEIRLDNVDVCVGAFWETPERRRLAPFTSQMFADHMRLVSMPRDFTPAAEFQRGSAFDYSILYRHIVRPFANEVWCIVGGMLVCTGILMWACERNAPRSRYKREGLASGVLKSTWVSFMSLLSATSALEASCWAGRLVMAGHAFFVYVAVVLYVANLTTLLMNTQTNSANIEELADVSRMGSKVCLLEAMSTAVQTMVPKQHQHFVDAYGPAIEKVYRGGCAATIIGFFEYNRFIRAQTANFTVCTDPADSIGGSTCTTSALPARIDLNCKCRTVPHTNTTDVSKCKLDCPFGIKRYCPLVEVVDPNFAVSLSIALPTKAFLQNQLSAWIIRLRQNGQLQKSITEYAMDGVCDVCGKSYTAEKCPEINAGNSSPTSAPGTSQLDLSYMSGIYVWSAGIMVLGGVVSIISRILGAACPMPPDEASELEIDVWDRDEDVAELVKSQGTKDVDALVFERKLARDLDSLCSGMDVLGARVRELQDRAARD